MPHARVYIARSRWIVSLGVALVVGCVFTLPPPLPEEAVQPTAGVVAIAGPPTEPESSAPPSFKDGDPPSLGMNAEEMKAYAIAQGDPEQGDFTLEEALADLPGEGDLWIQFRTFLGTLTCRLFPDETPITVANFVGLARGLRPARDPETGEWSNHRFYDGTQFHRVIEGFMIQGGDPIGTGMGGAGYVIPDEFLKTLSHDRAGILSMANRGAGTGSSQFFITLGPTQHLDDKHTIFGECTGPSIEIAEAIAATRGPDDRPTTPVIVERLDVTRGSEPPAQSGSGAPNEVSDEPSPVGGVPSEAEVPSEELPTTEPEPPVVEAP